MLDISIGSKIKVFGQWTTVEEIEQINSIHDLLYFSPSVVVADRIYTTDHCYTEDVQEVAES